MQVEDFHRVRKLDLKDGEADWLLSWKCSENFHKYKGHQDLIRWFEWTAQHRSYLPAEQVEPLARLSEAKNREIIGDEYSYQRVDEYNATDYLFQNLYHVPRRMRVRRILDFGAGYGRQINLWSQLHPDIVYVGMDAVELPYCLQNFYYSHFDLPLVEYIEDKEEFAIEESPAIYHLPTWRYDLLPSGFFDMVICVQVLQEISERLARHMIGVFYRCLKPGGALYIRDHGTAWQPAHHLDFDMLLPRCGFVLEFRPYVADSYNSQSDIHGIPRIWRKVEERTVRVDRRFRNEDWDIYRALQ